jgi:hypothetical protein
MRDPPDLHLRLHAGDVIIQVPPDELVPLLPEEALQGLHVLDGPGDRDGLPRHPRERTPLDDVVLVILPHQLLLPLLGLHGGLDVEAQEGREGIAL